jgi:hypothetical protein
VGLTCPATDECRVPLVYAIKTCCSFVSVTLFRYLREEGTSVLYFTLLPPQPFRKESLYRIHGVHEQANIGIVRIFLGSFALRYRSAQHIPVPPGVSYYGKDGPWGPVTVNYSGYLSSGSSDEEVNEHLARDTQLMKTAKAKSYARKLSEGDWTEGF